MSGDSYRGFHLLSPVIEIHKGNAVLRRVIFWISFALVVILDLLGGWNSLLTEGQLIASATAGGDFGSQTKLISLDNLAHHLS